MEIPDLVRQRLGEEDIESAVNLGDDDLACFTPSRTIIYRSEGLLSDDSVDVFDHTVERLAVSEGRRKTKFTLEYVDRRESFSVAGDRADPILQRLLGGVLRTAGVIDADEDVAGVYRFSEMTVIVAERRLVKRVGSYVWDEDFEEYPFADVTGLSFEEGSVATQIVLSVDGRPQRIKAPNDEAPLIKQTLTNVLCEFYDVASLDALRDEIGTSEPDRSGGGGASVDSASDLALDDSITPLVGSDDPVSEETTADGIDAVDDSSHSRSESAETDGPATGNTGEQASASSNTGGNATSESTSGGNAASEPTAIDPEEFHALKERVATLTTAVQRQNELLKKQHSTIQSLTDEIRED